MKCNYHSLCDKPECIILDTKKEERRKKKEERICGIVEDTTNPDLQKKKCYGSVDLELDIQSSKKKFVCGYQE